MDKILHYGQVVIEQGPAILGYTVAALGSLLAIALIIPGDQPDNFLQGCVNFLNKFSKK